MIFGGVFHDYFEQPWEVAASFVREEFEQLYTTLAANWNRAFSSDGTLTPDAIAGDNTINTSYVSNEGENHSPKWAKVNLVNGVKGRLQFSHVEQGVEGRLIGVSTASSSGDLEPIILGDGLSMLSNVLSVDASALNIASYVPLSAGTEPLQFISDGAGSPILVEYQP